MRLRIKVCGITSAADARLAAALGADAIGLIFAPESPRRVSMEQAAEIVDALPPFVTRVGVFVNESPERIAAIARRVRLDQVQLHGEESPEVCRGSPLPWYKAFRVDDRFDESALERYPAPVHLLDGWSPERRGGTGEAVDREVAARLARRYAIILSGGLGPENAVAAVEQVSPAAIDVNSGVERSPGVKDRDKLAALFEALRRSGHLGGPSIAGG